MDFERRYVETLTLDALDRTFRLSGGGGLPNADEYVRLDCFLRGRAVIGTADATLVPQLSPMTFIRRIYIYGDLPDQRVTLCDMTGAQLFAFSALVTGQLPYLNTDSLVDAVGVQGTYDFECMFHVPLAVLGKLNAMNDMLKRTLTPGYRFSNPLQVEITTGGSDSIVDRAATTTVTLTAYGSATGSPTMSITKVLARAIGAENGQRFLSQRVSAVGQLDSSAAATDTRLTTLGRNKLYSRILVRNGVGNGDSQPEMNTGTLANLTRLRLKRSSGNEVRNEDFLAQAAAFTWEQGYSPGYRETEATTAAGYTAGTQLRQLRGFTGWDFVVAGDLGRAMSTLDWPFDLELWRDAAALTNARTEVLTESLIPLR